MSLKKLYMIKSYTDLEQSKKLAEILPHESADMFYPYFHNPISGASYYEEYPIFNIPMNKSKSLPCWSLAVLLGVLDFPCLTQINENEWEVCAFDHDNSHYFEKTASSPVDACVAMIEKLHELKIL